MSDLIKTQHYTTNAAYICQGLIEDIPKDVNLIEPFVGKGDLLSLFPFSSWKTYDIDNSVKADYHQDTLKNPPDYSNKWVITNPPFLAKNKAQDKTLFNQYNENDLYKIALKTFIGCAGGLLIIPLNFFTDEDSAAIRSEFLSKYEIKHINIFTEPVFISTSYSVCAFSFYRKDNIIQELKATILPENSSASFIIDKTYNYRLAGHIFSLIDKEKPVFGRLTANNNLPFILNLNLQALDTRTESIHIIYTTDHYIGKQTDRMLLTFTSQYHFTEEQQRRMADDFNEYLKTIRKQYYNLILTNYRDWNRKRIGFTFAYKLLTHICRDLGYIT